MNKTIVIHVLGYRAASYLKKNSLCQMLESAKRIKNHTVHFVFQDNYSQDGSIEIALSTPNIDVLLSTSNLMYTGGINSGLQYIEQCYHPDYVILADADNFCEKDLYCKLINFMENNPNIGMAQPLVVSAENPSYIYSCGHHYTEGLFCCPMHVLPSDQSLLFNLESCSICSSIIRMDVLREIGLLNDAFKIYYESSDLSFRIRNIGFSCACCKDALAYNNGTITTATSNYHETYYRMRNGLLFWYLHEQNAFMQMKERYLDMLEPLNKIFHQNKFCTDCIAESTRKGIVDGLEFCQNNSLEAITNMIPKLEDFDKSKLIVLRQGGKINES